MLPICWCCIHNLEYIIYSISYPMHAVADFGFFALEVGPEIRQNVLACGLSHVAFHLFVISRLSCRAL